jgi:integrase
MARPEKRLTARGIATIKEPGLHADGDNLYLHVSQGGAKSWIFRWKANGRLRDMGLGSVRTISLADARNKALAYRKAVYDGRDPIEERRALRQAAKLETAKAMTFKQCAEAYIAAHRAGWRNAKHAAQWPATLETYVYPVMGDLPVQAVDVGLVMKVLQPIWQTRTETASRVRGRIESVLDWATARGYRQGDNPARWRGHIENLLPRKSKVARVEHLAALPYAELPGFMDELRRQEGIAARALEFTILTCSRTGEVIGAQWSEIDLEGRLWTIPASRMKAGKEHRVPLSEAAMDILRAMAQIRTGGHVFPGNRTGQQLSQVAMLITLRCMGRNDVVVHGFRSAFADWTVEQTSFSSEARELALAHTIGNRVEAAYRRGDLFEQRRLLAQAWAQFCAARATGQVVPIRQPMAAN